MRPVRTKALQEAVARRLPTASRTYPEGRVCAASGCDTRISVYNGSDLCWRHQPVRIPPTRGRRRAGGGARGNASRGRRTLPAGGAF